MARRRRSISEAFGAGHQEPDREQSTLKQPDQQTSEKGEPEGRTRQYGRRADPGRYAQVNANVPSELKREVQKRLIDEERTLQELIEELLEQYLQGKAG